MTRLPRSGRDDDRGFALVFVLFVTTVIMMGVATALSTTTPNIMRAKQTQDVAEALSAAQSGIDDAIAYLVSVPECRSQTRICAKALDASTDKLAQAKTPRPTTLAAGQSFSWFTGKTVTDDGYVRVTSTGSADGVSRRLVADLSLAPSILAYGYYSDYESQAPSFFDSYLTKRSIYIASSGLSASWDGAAASASTNSPDTVCGQHWYRESSASPGRYTAYQSSAKASVWTETGKYNNSSRSRYVACDLVFTTGMTENGRTYTRDALRVSYSTGSGPIFAQPVYTMWGYTDGQKNYTTPSPGGNVYLGDTLSSSSTYKPVVAPYDLTLPASVGTDGVADNSCVYFGPTRVKLNGNGTATVTSPKTTTRNPASDPACYPSSLSSGIVGFTLNYASVGSGIIYVKNLNKPATDWPQTSLTSQSTPSASNEIFWFPATGGAATNPNSRTNTAAAPSTACSSSNKYSATAGATCAWTGVATSTDASSSTGWTSYSTSTTCSGNNAATNRQLFECEYSQRTTNAQPPANQYGALRTLIQADVTGGSCLSTNTTTEASCLTAQVNARLKTANSGGKAFDATTFASGNHRYVATATPAADATTTTNVGAVPTNTGPSDALLITTPSAAARETHYTTPITITVKRQLYSNNAWGSDTPQFTFTVSPSVWTFTPAVNGAMYFPNPSDVTTYDTGATSTGAAAGSTGSAQPGDVYLEGVNKGPLSVIADNDVEITNNITSASGDTSTSDPLSITAGQDIRNYHPVSCTDQTAADVLATTPGFCPNDLTGIGSTTANSDGTFPSTHPAAQYTNILGTGNRTVDAALFTLTGSLRTDNYDRAVWVGNLYVNGGIYQSHRGANGVSWGSSGTPARSGTSLQYTYVDLERANLPYAPPASNSANPRPWNVVSISAGS